MKLARTIAFFALLSFAFAARRKDFCEILFRRCDFRFHGFPHKVPVFHLPFRPDFPFTPPIVSTVPHEFLGVLNTNRIIPEFVFNHFTKPITFFGHPRFTPTHFKPFSIPPRHKQSGIGHQTFTGNQFHVARGKCIRIFFTHYQVLQYPHGPVKDNRNDVPKFKNKCVVFRTR